MRCTPGDHGRPGEVDIFAQVAPEDVGGSVRTLS